MVKKSEYIQSLVSTTLQSGKLRTLDDLMKIVPKDVVATRLAKTEKEVDLLLKGVMRFKLSELYSIGHYCGLTTTEIYIIAEASYFMQKIK